LLACSGSLDDGPIVTVPVARLGKETLFVLRCLPVVDQLVRRYETPIERKGQRVKALTKDPQRGYSSVFYTTETPIETPTGKTDRLFLDPPM